MEELAIKRRGRPRKVVPDAGPTEQAGADAASVSGHGQVSETGTATPLTRQQAERRRIGMMNRMLLGESFLIRKNR